MLKPILMTEEIAREYLAGCDPVKLTPPIRLGKRKFWATAALDRAVAKKAGLPEPDSLKPKDAYDAWKAESAA